MQWKQQFLQWCTIKDQSISVFTAEQKEKVSVRLAIIIGDLTHLCAVHWRRRDSRFDVLNGGKSTKALS